MVVDVLHELSWHRTIQLGMRPVKRKKLQSFPAAHPRHLVLGNPPISRCPSHRADHRGDPGIKKHNTATTNAAFCSLLQTAWRVK